MILPRCELSKIRKYIFTKGTEHLPAPAVPIELATKLIQISFNLEFHNQENLNKIFYLTFIGKCLVPSFHFLMPF